MRNFIGILCLPLTALLLLIAAIAEPSFAGEVAWLWWIVGILGGFPVFGWALGESRS